MTGDAQYTFSSDQEMLDYTLRQTEGKDVIILLMHEGKARTRRILPELVAYFREAGYEFRALSTSEEDRGILSRCGAHMMLPTRRRNKGDKRNAVRMSAVRNVYDSIGGHELRLRLPGMPVSLPGVHGHEYRRQPRESA